MDPQRHPGPGQPNGGTVPVPQANLSSTTPVADAQVIDPPVPTPGERKLQLHLQMVNPLLSPQQRGPTTLTLSARAQPHL